MSFVCRWHLQVQFLGCHYTDNRRYIIVWRKQKINKHKIPTTDMCLILLPPPLLHLSRDKYHRNDTFSFNKSHHNINL